MADSPPAVGNSFTASFDDVELKNVIGFSGYEMTQSRAAQAFIDENGKVAHATASGVQDMVTWSIDMIKGDDGTQVDNIKDVMTGGGNEEGTFSLSIVDDAGNEVDSHDFQQVEVTGVSVPGLTAGAPGAIPMYKVTFNGKPSQDS